MSSVCLNHPELVHKHPAHLVSHQTYTNHIITEISMRQGVQGAYALVWGGSSTSNLLEPQHHRGEVCHMSLGWFDCSIVCIYACL